MHSNGNKDELKVIEVLGEGSPTLICQKPPILTSVLRLASKMQTITDGWHVAKGATAK